MLDHRWEFNADDKKKADDPTFYNTHPELDDDMKMTQHHEATAQKWLDLAEGKGKKEKSLLQTSSDPICNSAGCTQYKWPKADPDLSHPMNYFVPNFGTHDRTEVLTTWNSLDVAQRQLNHVWNLDKDWKKPGPDPTLYNYAPELDDDMISTQKHEDAAVKKYGAWDWKALQLDEMVEEKNYEQQ